MRYLSLFSGIEACSQAWGRLGWECVGVSEIEPFPCAVLAHHYPGVKNFGDITKITKEDVCNLGADLVVGGFPCQDLSVAGKREGLNRESDGTKTRSGLFYDAVSVFRWSGARYCLLENVPGLLSSKRGNDFAAVVGTLCGTRFDSPEGGWKNHGFAVGPEGLAEWCVLDAQNFGVPQRRRRVFILFTRNGFWEGRPPVLFERHTGNGNPSEVQPFSESLCGDIEEGESQGEEASRGTGKGSPVGGSIGSGVANPLGAKGAQGRMDLDNDTYVPSGKCFSVREDAKAGNFSATPIDVGLAVNALVPGVQSHHAQVFVVGKEKKDEGYVPKVCGALSDGAHNGGVDGQDAYTGRIIATPKRLRTR